MAAKAAALERASPDYWPDYYHLPLYKVFPEFHRLWAWVSSSICDLNSLRSVFSVRSARLNGSLFDVLFVSGANSLWRSLQGH